MFNQKLGRYGEKLASKYLKRKGYRVLEKNFQTRCGEIDIIAYDHDAKQIVFVEVKTRTSRMFGDPEKAVSKEKILHLSKAVEIYIQQNNTQHSVRMDAVSIVIPKFPGSIEIEHFENIESS